MIDADKHARHGEQGTEIIALGDKVIEYDPEDSNNARYIAGGPNTNQI